MKRVILDGNGIRASKAGYDVTSASQNQLLFNSGWKMFSVLLQGSIALSAFTTDSDTTSGSTHSIARHYTINFGVTLPSVPMCIITTQDPMQTDGTCIGEPYINSLISSAYSDNGYYFGTGGSAGVSYVATTSQLTLNYGWSSTTYSPPNPSYFNYTVMRLS